MAQDQQTALTKALDSVANQLGAALVNKTIAEANLQVALDQNRQLSAENAELRAAAQGEAEDASPEADVASPGDFEDAEGVEVAQVHPESSTASR